MPQQTPNDDFWSNDIGGQPLRTPVTIMREKAAQLGPKTDHQVIAEVVTHTGEYQNFEHLFYFVVPSLQNYRYRLFTARHDVELYPVQINVDLQENYNAVNEGQFLDALRTILSSPKTTRIVKGLKGQVEA